MKGLAICSKGIEDICATELKELINARTKLEEGAVIFSFNKWEDLFLLCYKAQSVDKILLLFDYFRFKEDLFERLESAIKKANIGYWIDEKTRFRVSCKKTNRNKNILSEEILSKTGSFIINKIKETKKFKPKVDLEDPDLIFFVFINSKDTCFFGLDFSGTELNKRDYKIFSHRGSLRGTIAYSLVRIAKVKENEVLLDPFCRSGEIPIESAIFLTSFPVNYFSKNKLLFLRFRPFKNFNFENFFSRVDNKIKKLKKTFINCFDSDLRNITAAKKNAKIAGINKIINFSRLDLEWLDTKLSRGSIDKIITHPIEFSKNKDVKAVEKIYREFFYQAEFILKRDGKIVIIFRKKESFDLLEKCASEYGFIVIGGRTVYCGKEPFTVSVFEKIK